MSFIATAVIAGGGAFALGASATTALAVGAGAGLLSSSLNSSNAAGDAAAAQAAGLSANAAATTEVARIQQESAREYLNFQKEQYADLKPLAESISNAQLQGMNQQMRIADANETRAREYYDYERGTFRPVEQAIVRDAQDFNTASMRERLASRAQTDVALAYQQQRQNLIDQMARYGINPNSNRFAALNASLARAEALDTASAATNARMNAEQLGYARMLDAASLGRNLASNSSTAYGLATTAGTAGVNSGTSALSTAAAPGAALGTGYGNFSNQMGNASNSFYGAGNLYGSAYRTSAYQQAQADQGTSNLIGLGIKGGLGYLTGGWAGAAAAVTGSKFADGGKVHEGKGAVRGPGGPVDDKVPAMLSNGEYVLPADTTAAIGKDRLDKIVKQTHTPASVQRRRAALQGA